MPATAELLQVTEYGGEGYAPLVDYATWRVAVLRYIDELLPENLATMQRHDETDEVFVLLAGRCILFIGGAGDQVGEIFAADLEPRKLFNVKRGTWHTHTLSQDASVLIVENRDTTEQNSPQAALTAAERATLLGLTHQLWSKGSVV